MLSRLHKSAASPHLRQVLRQYELVAKLRPYNPDAHERLINRAPVFSMNPDGGSQFTVAGSATLTCP